ADVGAVGVDAHRGRAGQRLQRPDRGHQLHAVVRGGPGVAAVELLLDGAVAQHRTPAARAGVPAARAVGVDLHDALGHALTTSRRMPDRPTSLPSAASRSGRPEVSTRKVSSIALRISAGAPRSWRSVGPPRWWTDRRVPLRA